MAGKFCLIFFLLVSFQIKGQNSNLLRQAEQAMLKATRYMTEVVSTNGGYVSRYYTDFSRRWGELEAYKSQIWMTYGLTPKMGHTFLDAFEVTGDAYYYSKAEDVAEAIIWGQLPSGGWDYIIDFAGDRSLKQWFKTIGRNAWGWDEYNHYYGVPTFKNGTTIEAARFLLRIYLEKLDPKFKQSLEKAIDFVINSQYPLGGWPQRWPQKAGNQFTFTSTTHSKYFQGDIDYTHFYILNDSLTWENIEFLIQCYITLGEERFLDPIRRGMNFYLLAQQGPPQSGWALQYDMNLKPAHGRQYEPASLSPGDTYRICFLLMEFYKYTGERKFLGPIPNAIRWLEESRLPQEKTNGGKYTHPVFVEIGTNKPIYAHRKGTGVDSGYYWIDYNDKNPLLHYGAKTRLDLNKLKISFDNLYSVSPTDATKDSPLIPSEHVVKNSPQLFFRFERSGDKKIPETTEVEKIIQSMDTQGRWLSKHEWISRPFTISKDGGMPNTAVLSTEGGATILDPSEQEYISVEVFMKNIGYLLDYIATYKNRIK